MGNPSLAGRHGPDLPLVILSRPHRNQKVGAVFGYPEMTPRLDEQTMARISDFEMAVRDFDKQHVEPQSLEKPLQDSIERTRDRKDLRWCRVQDSTLVLFEGEITTWGQLSVFERKEVDMNADGLLTGGMPF